uniref:MurR/RpiR family transcriptional regulator n=1 Tax=Thaumasiovibrio occultus TaxID=1891184 RepID=UPI000B35D354|nr:MurR/RpiR family transcriptional regulator [Thaumasiovibrio occultus]
MRENTLFERIRNLPKLTNSDRKIVEYLEGKYPHIAFETIITIAEGSHVANASVGRFVQRLHYENFADFIKCVRDEVSGKLESPLERYQTQRNVISSDEKGILERHINNASKNMHDTSLRLNDADILAAANLLIADKRKIFICGGASSHALASFFHIYAKNIRQQVYLLEGDLQSQARQLIDVDKNSVLFAISHKRYSQTTLNIAKWFKGKKGTLIALSDQETSPILPLADIAFVAKTEGPAMFDSKVVSLLVLEAIIETMIVQSEAQSEKRVKKLEVILNELETFHS